MPLCAGCRGSFKEDELNLCCICGQTTCDTPACAGNCRCVITEYLKQLRAGLVEEARSRTLDKPRMARRLMYRGKRMAGATGRAMVKAGVLAGFAFFTNVWLHQHGINPSPAVTNNVAIGLAAAALHRRSGA